MKANGITLFILSNSRLRGRVEAFAGALGIGYVKAAGTPSPTGLLRAMLAAGFEPFESALAGDQIFTDVLAANAAGAMPVIVRPKNCVNPFFAVRYALEAPFRALARGEWKMESGK
jgi:predicted HAD superfamily phosphohydrolase YqeG